MHRRPKPLPLRVCTERRAQGLQAGPRQQCRASAPSPPPESPCDGPPASLPLSPPLLMTGRRHAGTPRAPLCHGAQGGAAPGAASGYGRRRCQGGRRGCRGCRPHPRPVPAAAARKSVWLLGSKPGGRPLSCVALCVYLESARTAAKEPEVNQPPSPLPPAPPPDVLPHAHTPPCVHAYVRTPKRPPTAAPPPLIHPPTHPPLRPCCCHWLCHRRRGPAALVLQLARLLALSYGEARLTEERWQQVLALEHARQCRLRVV